MGIYKNIREYKVDATVKMVSPEEALKFLGKMCHNRRLKPSLVKKYAAAILAGQWKVNGEAIVLSKSGILLDGQHRLRAIVKAGIPVPMIIITGIDDSREVLATINDGASRTLTDVIVMDGCVVNNIHTATLRSMMQGITQTSKAETQVAFSKIDLMNKFEKHKDAIDFAVQALRNRKGIISAPTAAAIARAYYHISKADLQRFCDALVLNYPQSPDERPACLLHSFLMSVHGGLGGANSRKARYRKTERALFAFQNKNKITKLYESTDELFPLPEEIEDREFDIPM